MICEWVVKSISGSQAAFRENQNRKYYWALYIVKIPFILVIREKCVTVYIYVCVCVCARRYTRLARGSGLGFTP